MKEKLKCFFCFIFSIVLLCLSFISCRSELVLKSKINNITYEKYITLNETEIEEIIKSETFKILKSTNFTIKNIYFNKVSNTWYGEIDDGMFINKFFIEYNNEVIFTLIC